MKWVTTTVISTDLCEISPFCLLLHLRENALKPFRFSDKPKGKNLTKLPSMRNNVPMYNVVLRVSCLYEYANVLEYFSSCGLCMLYGGSFLYAPSRTCCYIGSSNSFGSTISNTKTCFCCSFPSSVPIRKQLHNTIAYSYIFRQFPVRPPSFLIDCTKCHFLNKNSVTSNPQRLEKSSHVQFY